MSRPDVHPSVVDQLPSVIDSPHIIIPLVGRWSSFYTVVDADMDDLANYRWYGSWTKRRGSLYAQSCEKINGKWRTVFLHLKVLRRFLGSPPKAGMWGDHIDCYTLDNRSSQLRWVTGSGNALNRSVLSVRNHSGYKGVALTRRGEISVIMKHSGRSVSINYDFWTPEEAALAYDFGARIIDPELEFIRLNNPPLDQIRPERIEQIREYVGKRFNGKRGKEKTSRYPGVWNGRFGFESGVFSGGKTYRGGTFSTQEKAYYASCYLKWILTGEFDDSLLGDILTEEEKIEIEGMVWARHGHFRSGKYLPG